MEGDRIRESSKFCQFLKEKMEKELEELERERALRSPVTDEAAAEKV